MGRVLNTIRTVVPTLGVITLIAGTAACGSDDAASPGSAEANSVADDERPRIVVTTNILGDVVSSAVGDQADVEVIMPLGSDPHDFAPSARQAESMEDADLLVVNGAGFEDGMLDIIANVSDFGTEVFAFAEQVELLEFTGEHDDEHSEEGGDPHIWTDPTRVATALEALEPVVANLRGVDSDQLSASVDAYLSELSALGSSIEETLADVPDERRVLVTNHEVFGYFADRFDFEIIGAVIPSLTTSAEPSAADTEELAELIESEGIPAIFGETTQSSTLAEVLADQVGGTVEVVELFTESLDDEGSGAETYIGMMQSNADLVAGALAT